MRTTGLGAAVCAAAMVGALGVPPSSTALTGSTGGVSTGSTGAQEARSALHQVRAAFGDVPHARATPSSASRELTLLLRDLRNALPALDPAQRKTARAYLARPTDGTEPFGSKYAATADATSDCAAAPTPGSPVCVHFARHTKDAPPAVDSDGDGLPDQVETTRAVLTHVWDRVVTRGGYRPPLPDDRGPDDRLDVYLVDIGPNIYGYCVNEDESPGRASPGYCVLDDDYRDGQFPRHTPRQNLQVTAAHEFFHAVQFAYDAQDDPWFMESTATWVEDEIYDHVDDNRFYLPFAMLGRPSMPLDLDDGGLSVYGTWIWWRYLTERLTDDSGTGLPTVVRDVWERAAGPGPSAYSVAALADELAERGLPLERAYAGFGTANRTPGWYAEGRAYPRTPFSRRHRLTEGRPGTGEQRMTVDHLSHRTIGFVPGAGLRRGATLRLRVTLPAVEHQPTAVVRVFGRADRRTTRLQAGPAGAASLRVPFGPAVRRVELTFTNGGHRYVCRTQSWWSCSGTPLSDDLRFRYAARARG